MSHQDSPPAGDRAEELRRQLVAAARRVCPPWLQSRIEDIAHSAIVRILQMEKRSGAIRTLRPSYLKKAAYTAMVDELRRQFRAREYGVDDLDDLETSPGRSSSLNHPPGEIDGAIRACMGRMVRPRRIAVACNLQGYSAPEMAELLGWTAKKAGHLVQRGLRDLRECLESKGVKP